VKEVVEQRLRSTAALIFQDDKDQQGRSGAEIGFLILYVPVFTHCSSASRVPLKTSRSTGVVIPGTCT